jgi:hypothetical protein
MDEVQQIKAEHDATVICYLKSIGEEVYHPDSICMVEYDVWNEDSNHVQRKEEWKSPFSGIVDMWHINPRTFVKKG